MVPIEAAKREPGVRFVPPAFFAAAAEGKMTCFLRFEFN